jgi:hypothetical protein
MNNSYYVVSFIRSDSRAVNTERFKHVCTIPEARAILNRNFATRAQAETALLKFEKLTGLTGEVSEACSI